MRKAIPIPELEELEAAHRTFEEKEPRDLFYRVATEVVSLVIRHESSLSLAEALAVLLQTWNSSYYRFHGGFNAQHFADLEEILERHAKPLPGLRNRSIETLSAVDENTISPIFSDFEHTLGPVGAAKALHLLAPTFFPIWDRGIASAYGLALKNRGANSQQYLRFMKIAQTQAKALGNRIIGGRNALKMLDEYNYCKFSRGWTGDDVNQPLG